MSASSRNCTRLAFLALVAWARGGGSGDRMGSGDLAAMLGTANDSVGRFELVAAAGTARESLGRAAWVVAASMLDVMML